MMDAHNPFTCEDGQDLRVPDHLLASDAAYQKEVRDVDEGGQKSEAELASARRTCLRGADAFLLRFKLRHH